MSEGGDNSGKPPRGPTNKGPMTPLNRLKAVSQLRQVLRATPTKGGTVALDLVNIVSVGLLNKVQQLMSFTDLSTSAAAAASSGKGDSNSSEKSSAASPNNNNGKEEDKKDGQNSSQTGNNNIKEQMVQVTPLGTPIKKPPTLPPIEIPASVLRNAIEINSQNNKVIEQNVKPSPKKTHPLSDDPMVSAEGMEPFEPDKPRSSSSPDQTQKFLETNLQWQNIESRTKHLVGIVSRACVSTSISKHLLCTHLDDLFSHVYQYHETRNAAIEAGAVKVLNKVLKYHPDLYITHRTREILALLGINPPTKGQGIKILAIDGGGVRGLVALEVLRALERITGKRIYQLFDYICGVSTGSVLAFLLGAHKKTLDEAEALYKDLSQQIFMQNSFFGSAQMLWSHSYYHTPTFERILKKHCGELPLISLARDHDLPRVSAISTVVNQERVCPYVFRTYSFPPAVRAKYLGGCRYHMWEAVRASAAAPTYFEEIKLGNYLHQDGGVLCNNPTSVAISEARTIWPDQPLQSVVSLGTGLLLSSRTDKNLNDLIEHGKEGLSYLSWKGKFLKVLDSATDTESVHNTLNELLPHSIYFRFNPYLSDVVRLDEASPEKLDSVQLETRTYLERNVEKVEFACKTLLKEKGMSKKLVDWWYH